MIDTDSFPGWMAVDGILFSRAELLRRRPAWYWLETRRRAWRGFRMRMVVVDLLIEAEEIDQKLTWVEIRLFLQGDEAAIGSAKELTAHAKTSALLARLVKLRGVTFSPTRGVAA